MINSSEAEKSIYCVRLDFIGTKNMIPIVDVVFSLSCWKTEWLSE
jgi:hypothetical protein